MPLIIIFKTNDMNYQPAPEGKDPYLWQLAQRRASFKRHLATYIIVNAFLWLIWAFSGARTHEGSIPWPLWSTLGWGIGLASHYVSAYIASKENSVEKEYEKLKQNQR
jgi:hypothetical protein